LGRHHDGPGRARRRRGRPADQWRRPGSLAGAELLEPLFESESRPGRVGAAAPAADSEARRIIAIGLGFRVRGRTPSPTPSRTCSSRGPTRTRPPDSESDLESGAGLVTRTRRDSWPCPAPSPRLPPCQSLSHGHGDRHSDRMAVTVSSDS
jgi:hypothetical protein